MNDTLIPLIIVVVILVLILISVVACPTPKCCQKPENKQETIVVANLFYVNSVYLPTETNVEIPLENRNTENINLNLSSESNTNLKVDFDLPPSYRDLYGK